ncbi:hypothetical protein AK812_SmicGene21773 [Symbiodinium microadriaticum]|uniref:Uncharacterized protein n=1 Tax=Symbiodinium microadriaticum TaxID=2951 RepID=A0A1Q9DLF0_SYMMI|nr:hypothetical protein AK812_SmicGene21773 [Symbiodinium microadriaticum]
MRSAAPLRAQWDLGVATRCDFTAVDCGQRRGAASSGHFKSIGLPVQRNVVPAAKASQVVYASSCAPQTSKYSTSTMAAAAIFDFTLRFNVAAEVQPARGNGCALRTDMPIARQQHAPSLNTGVMRITDSMVRCGLDTAPTYYGWDAMEVCLQLCVAMSRCLAAERKDEKPSRDRGKVP